jgi:hypothetical protein
VAAGVIAALRTDLPYDDTKPETSPAAVRNMVTKTAEDKGLLGYDFEYGWGIISGCALADHLCKPDDGGGKCRCGCRCLCKCLAKCLERCCGQCCDDCDGGGGIERPDLVPRPGPNGFCRREDGVLIVTVCNQGSAPAGPSTTTVDFPGHASVNVPTPAIPARGCVDVRADIPLGCFDPDCEFRITVDSGGVVAESDETNNTASGRCIG